jgi:hypothetical protein
MVIYNFWEIRWEFLRVLGLVLLLITRGIRKITIGGQIREQSLSLFRYFERDFKENLEELREGEKLSFYCYILFFSFSLSFYS